MKRFALTAAFAAVLACMVVMPGSAASFDDSNPCPADGPLLVCPKAHVGQPYSLQLRALAGCDLYRWEITNGALPAGLTISSSGVVSGTPSASGATQPWVTVHDLLPSEGGYPWCGGDNHSERQFVFETEPGLSIQTQSVPGGTVSQPYSVTLTAFSVTSTNPVQGSPAQATWSVQSGNLPAGVTLSPQGVLSGTPTGEGSFTFVVRAVGGGDTSDTETETLTVRQALVATSPFHGAALKAEVGIPYTAAVTATGGSGTYSYALTSGTLPEGLQLGTDGRLAGTPTVPGRYTFGIGVSDNEGRKTTVNGALSVSAQLAILTLKLKPTKVGRVFRSRIETVGGAAPKQWTILRGKLPPGVNFAKKLGLFLGTPRKAGTYRLTLQVVDPLGATATKNITIVVQKGVRARRAP
jgi:large repetitive protein